MGWSVWRRARTFIHSADLLLMTKQADKRKGTSPILRVSVVCDAELIDL